MLNPDRIIAGSVKNQQRLASTPVTLTLKQGVVITTSVV